MKLFLCHATSFLIGESNIDVSRLLVFLIIVVVLSMISNGDNDN